MCFELIAIFGARVPFFSFPVVQDRRSLAGLIEHNKAKFIRNQTNMSFKQQGFINEPFPHQPDLILCRDMIQHNSLVDGVRAYYNIERSGAKYLATTWHQQGANRLSHTGSSSATGILHHRWAIALHCWVRHLENR